MYVFMCVEGGGVRDCDGVSEGCTLELAYATPAAHIAAKVVPWSSSKGSTAHALGSMVYATTRMM